MRLTRGDWHRIMHAQKGKGGHKAQTKPCKPRKKTTPKQNEYQQFKAETEKRIKKVVLVLRQ